MSAVPAVYTLLCMQCDCSLRVGSAGTPSTASPSITAAAPEPDLPPLHQADPLSRLQVPWPELHPTHLIASHCHVSSSFVMILYQTCHLSTLVEAFIEAPYTLLGESCFSLRPLGKLLGCNQPIICITHLIHVSYEADMRPTTPPLYSLRPAANQAPAL